MTPRPVFVAKKSNIVCGKCGGNGSHELSARDSDGWPIGPLRFGTCSHCKGEGELSAAVHKLEPPRPISEPPPIKIEDWGAPSPVDNPVSKGWAIFDGKQ